MTALTAETLPLLLRRAGLNPGDRILDVGCGDGSLVTALTESGFDAYGIDDDATPGDRILCGSPASGIPLEAAATKLAIVRGCDAFSGSTTPETFVAIANLFAVMQGQGTVAILTDAADELLGAMQAFDVAAAAETLGSPVGLIGRLFGKRPTSKLSLPIATLPASPLTKLEYHTIARESAMAKMTPMRRAA